MPRTAPRAHCPDPLHQGSLVRAWGTFERSAGRYRRYRCEPLTGDRHYFSVGIEGGRRRRSLAGQPECPGHRGSRVTRAGMYRRGSAQPRQRYECDHVGRCNAICRAACRGKHTFTPALPRPHVRSGDSCAECLELRGYHRGEVAAARRHRFSARIVARTLADMSIGLSYAKAGRQALEASGVTITTVPRAKVIARAKPAAPSAGARKSRRRSPATRLAGRFWHIGAGFLEAFAPVVWEATERRLRERAEQAAAAGLPRVWVLDDVPIYALDRAGKRKKTDGYSVLVLAEIDWTDPANPGALKLRLARALPKATGVAWRLLFEEVGYVPDMILSDAATPIINAVGRHFPDPGPLFVPSLWHLRRALENNALEHALRGDSAREMWAHLALLGRDSPALASVDAWREWWDRLEALGSASGTVKIGDLRRSRTNYEGRMAAAIPVLVTDPRLRQSTGGLESLIRSWIEPILHGRRHQYGNIERTNSLLDTAVCRAHGVFTDLNAVARLLEADEVPWGGWTVPLRSIADPRPRRGRYRSLRDEAQMVAVATERGVA